VAHTCNPSYSGDRDQEDRGLKPTPEKEIARPYLEQTLHKKGLVEWLKVKALNSSLSTTKTKNKKTLDCLHLKSTDFKTLLFLLWMMVIVDGELGQSCTAPLRHFSNMQVTGNEGTYYLCNFMRCCTAAGGLQLTARYNLVSEVRK
jgi:hypothetical protein